MASILILEDEMSIRMLLAKVFQMKGHDVLAFEDARPALESVDLDEVDLIITDYNMPMRGDIAVREIRDRGYDLPVIVMSGYLDEEIIDVLEGLAVQKILWKPFPPFDLVDVVEEILSRLFETSRAGIFE